MGSRSDSTGYEGIDPNSGRASNDFGFETIAVRQSDLFNVNLSVDLPASRPQNSLSVTSSFLGQVKGKSNHLSLM